MFSFFFGYSFLRFSSPPFLLTAAAVLLTPPHFWNQVGFLLLFLRFCPHLSNGLNPIVCEANSPGWENKAAILSFINPLNHTEFSLPNSPQFLPLSLLEPKFSFLSHLREFLLIFIPLFISYFTLGLCLNASSCLTRIFSLSQSLLRNSNHHFSESLGCLW